MRVLQFLLPRRFFAMVFLVAAFPASAQLNQAPLIFTETSNEVVLVGQVKSFAFSSPETLIELEVQGSAGQSSVWRALAPSAAELRRFGWTSQSLLVGELVQVDGKLVPESRLEMQIDRIVRATGQVLLPKNETVFDKLVSGTYRPNAAQGYIEVSFDHYGFSRGAFSFNNFEAQLVVDADSVSNSTFQMDVLTQNIVSNSAALTLALKSPAFFDTANFPIMSVRATSITLAGDSDLLVRAEVSIRGQSYPVDFEVKLNASGTHPETNLQTIGFSGFAQVLRSDWAMLGYIPEIPDLVRIDFQMEFELTPQSPLYPYSQ